MPKKKGVPQKKPRVTFTRALADDICVRISDGMSLQDVCSIERMPTRRTVYKWLKAHPEFADAYDRSGDTKIAELLVKHGSRGQGAGSRAKVVRV